MIILKLRNGTLSVKDGYIGAKFSANVKISLDSDLEKYTHLLYVEYIESGEKKKAMSSMLDGFFVIPAAAFKEEQYIMLSVSSTSGKETIISNPLHVRVQNSAYGGSILPTTPETWEAYIDTYLASKGLDGSDLDEIKQDVSDLKEDLNDLRSEFESGSSGVSKAMAQTLDAVVRAWAYESPSFATSQEYADFKNAWGIDESDTPVTPPEDEPDEPIDDGSNWEDGVPYELGLVANEYVDNGRIVSYNNWDRTDYLPCYGASRLVCKNNKSSTQYCAFYDAQKEFISKFGLSSATSVSNDTVNIPSEAHFLIVSNSSVAMSTIVLVPEA